MVGAILWFLFAILLGFLGYLYGGVTSWRSAKRWYSEHPEELGFILYIKRYSVENSSNR
jgi:hypothetical protein